MKKLRTAVVGLGRIGWIYHIPRIIDHEGFELAAIVDPLPERLDEGREKFNVKGYLDFSELLEKEDLDLVVIASPTPFHESQSIEAMKKGIDVFLEKPMAASLEEADRIIGAMREYGRKLMVYQPHRVSSDVIAVKKIIEEDIIGPVYMIKHARSAYARRNDWQALKKYGGGMVNNYGAHAIDALLYITNSTAEKINCNLRRIATLGDAEDVVKATIVTENGIILDLDINMAAAYPLPQWIIMGKRGTAVFEGRDRTEGVFKIKYYREEELVELTLNEELAAPGRLYQDPKGKIPWNEQVIDISTLPKMNFYDKCYEYFALGKEPLVPVNHTREVMRVMAECHRIGWQ
jgi:scyllo-inositol 2-dehydrogenase (NADP+)